MNIRIWEYKNIRIWQNERNEIPRIAKVFNWMWEFIEDVIKQCYHAIWRVRKNTEIKNPEVAKTKT